MDDVSWPQINAGRVDSAYASLADGTLLVIDLRPWWRRPWWQSRLRQYPDSALVVKLSAQRCSVEIEPRESRS